MTTEKERLRRLLRGTPTDHAPGGHAMPETSETPEPTPEPTVIEVEDWVEPTPDPAEMTLVSWDQFPKLLADLDAIDPIPAAPSPGRATLTMPLGRLIDADGTETVIAQAVVEVELVASEVLAVINGDPGAGDPTTVYVHRRFTPDGAAAIRQLMAWLDGQE